MKVRQIPAYVVNKGVENFKEYLSDHQNPKNRLGHHVGLVVGTAGGVSAMLLGVDPLIAVPAGTAAVYACAVPSHPIFEGNTSATMKRIKEINSFKSFFSKGGKALFYILCEPVMSLLAFTGLLRPIMRKMGLNPLGTPKTPEAKSPEVK